MGKQAKKDAKAKIAGKRKIKPKQKSAYKKNEDPNTIADTLLKDPEFAKDPEELQVERIRELPTNFANKQIIRERVIKKSEDMKNSPTLKLQQTLVRKKLKNKFDSFVIALTLWEGHLKKVEGQFGAGVSSFFIFLRWLFLLNILVFLFIFLLVILPQILHHTYNPSSNNDSFTGLEILTGDGWFSATQMYYGTYLNGTISVVSHSKYNMQLAYLCPSALCYLLTIFVLLISLINSYKTNFIDQTDGSFNFCSNKVLTGWQYSIVDKSAAQLRRAILQRELQVHLSTYRKQTKERSCLGRFLFFVIRCVFHVLIFTSIVGSGYLILYLKNSAALESGSYFRRYMLFPIAFTCINLMLPFLYAIAVSLEKYDRPEVKVYLTMVRTISLHLTTIGSLAYSWYGDLQPDENLALALFNVDKKSTGLSNSTCWENDIGQEIYRLVVLDFIFTLLFVFFSEFMRRQFSRVKWIKRARFNIGRNALFLIYSQTLVWLGSFFCPFLPFIMILKLLILFYVRRYSVTFNCSPSTHTWRAGRSHTVILLMLFLSFLLCFIFFGYGIIFLKPSMNCGPFQGQRTMYYVFTSLMDNWKNYSWMKDVLSFFTSAAFLIAVMVGLCVAVYYSSVIAKSLDQQIQTMQTQMKMEGKDKAFLTKIYHEVGQVRQKGTQKHNSAADLVVSPSVIMVGSSSSRMSATEIENPMYADDSFPRA